jgi:hypothetical protein
MTYEAAWNRSRTYWLTCKHVLFVWSSRDPLCGKHHERPTPS